MKAGGFKWKPILRAENAVREARKVQARRRQNDDEAYYSSSGVDDMCTDESCLMKSRHIWRGMHVRKT